MIYTQVFEQALQPVFNLGFRQLFACFVPLQSSGLAPVRYFSSRQLSAELLALRPTALTAHPKCSRAHQPARVRWRNRTSRRESGNGGSEEEGDDHEDILPRLPALRMTNA